MGIKKVFSGAIAGTFADQWREIVTVGTFDEQTAVMPGVLKRRNIGNGTNYSSSVGILTSGSKIYVPENTAAFVFNQSGIEAVITKPGGYFYIDGQESVFDGNGIVNPLVHQIKERFLYGGETPDEMRVAFINLREIRNLKFGTRGPMMYNDMYYGTDLEIQAYGTFSIIITDPVKFVRNYLPANTTTYSFASKEAREQIISELLQSFLVAVNSLSGKYRISQIPSQANELAKAILNDPNNAGTWEERFGFRIGKIGIQDIEFAPGSKELVDQYSANKMNLKAYEEISQKASNIGAQQKIASGIQKHGFGDGGAGTIMGINVANSLNANAGTKGEMSLDEQIETLKKLKELVDAGILTEEEFSIKKKEIMGL